MNYHAARAVLQRANAVLGTNWTLHDLRHTAAQRMLADPAFTLVDVQTILRHASVTTTQIYRPDGRPIHPDPITDWFTRLSWEAGLPPIRLHDVRHSYATAALRAGVAVKVVSERLGHSSVAFTQDTYMHVIPGMDEHGARVAALAILGPPEAASDTAVTTGVTIRADTPLA